MIRLLLVALFMSSAVTAAGPPELAPTPVPIAMRGGSTVASIRIALTGTATGSGALKIRFVPERGETREIGVNVTPSLAAEAVAKELAHALGEALAPEYSLKLSDPATITIQYGTRSVPFRVGLAAEPAPGIAVRFE